MIKVAVLGAGFMGKTHLCCYANNKLCKVEYIFDMNISKAERLAEEYGVRTSENIENILNSDVDIIDICLPTFLHKEYIKLAALAKKHIICEKPIALNVEEADDVIKDVTKNGVRFMTAHVVRFWPEYVYIKNAIATEQLGRPIYVSASRLQPIPGWSENNWIVNPKLSKGGVIDLQIHDLDFLSWILGKPSKLLSVGTRSCYGGWEQINTIIEHSSGVNSSIEACNLMPEGYPFTAKIRAVFTEGCIEYDSKAEKKLVMYRKGKKPEYPDINTKDGYQAEIDYFIDCVNQGKEISIVTLQDARNALLLATKSWESLESNTVIHFSQNNFDLMMDSIET